ncbi:MAG: hypothetical protein ACI9QD_001165 [Thermoproteota archaeon]
MLSRVGTGEFLKIDIDYSVNSKFSPTHVVVEKSLGMDNTEENFRINYEQNTLLYSFESNDSDHIVETTIPNKFQIVTPAFLTSTIYTHSTKLNATGRNQFVLMSSASDWDFNKEISTSTIFAEFLTHKKTELKVNDTELQCVMAHVFKHDSGEGIAESPAVFHISRHIGIPYMVETPEGVTIKVGKLEKFESFYESMF